MFFWTLNADILSFNLCVQTSWNFLPHYFKQVKYTILWLLSKKNVFCAFLGECNKNGNFEWFLKEKWPQVVLLGLSYLKTFCTKKMSKKSNYMDKIPREFNFWNNQNPNNQHIQSFPSFSKSQYVNN